MKKAGRVHRPVRPSGYETLEISERRSALREFGPIAFGGIALVMAFAFAGHYMGQNAIAHNAVPEDRIAAVVAPVSAIVSKGSLLPEGSTFDLVSLDSLRKQVVVEGGKGDYVIATAPQPLPAPTKTEVAAVKIIPAAVDLKEEAEEKIKPKLGLTPTKSKIEQSFKLKRGEKQKVVAQRRLRQAEENCLARAVYFEARSESELGQLAVAKVILNRTKNPAYPKTICGVVYQGSGSRNSCQFSFACDGLPDDVKSPAAWANSKRIAQKAMDGDQSVRAIGTATNYHADYVRPKWAKNMKRLIKIGRHIFYEEET